MAQSLQAFGHGLRSLAGRTNRMDDTYAHQINKAGGKSYGLLDRQATVTSVSEGIPIVKVKKVPAAPQFFVHLILARRERGEGPSRTLNEGLAFLWLPGLGNAE